MTADDWKRVKAIAMEAWGRPVAERIPYITNACAGTDGLEREVLSLVASMAAADTRFEAPACLPYDDAATLGSLVGQRVGAYEILSRIGAGGMGEVYKARDTRLNRIVAIKVLPAFASTYSVSRERMAREARAVAALNHPHICVIHDVGSHDGLDFFVMEYVDGETLAARLSRGPLPIAEALQYADQIASALGAAHRAGIVHRDVKPANIMLDRTGQRAGEEAPHATLLDFGVATANPVETASGPMPRDSDGNLTLTSPGFVLGTVYYTAPEQFEQKATDARADIFAFGAVLFEMLTGRKAFEGMDRAQIVADIGHKEVPRASSLRPEIPVALSRIVATCLAKSPDERYQTIDDLLVDLRAVRRRLDSSSRVRMLTIGAAVLVLLAGGTTAGLMWAGRDGVPATAPSVTRLAASAGVLGAPALSPDGSQVAFSWVGDGVDNPELVLLRIGSATRVRLTNDRGVEEWPAWSPDGTQLAFIRCATANCGIFTLPVGGGPERKVRDLRHDRYYGLAWSPDGRSLAYAERPSVSDPYALFLLSLNDSATRRITTPSGSGDLRFAFSPDGSTLGLIRVGGDGIGVHLLSIETGTDTALVSRQQEWFGAVTWTADGRHLILSANQQGIRRLWTLPIAGGGLEQLAIAGEDSYFPSVAVHANRLTFVHEFRDWDFSRMALSSGQVRPSAAFPSSPRIDLDPAFSPDGRTLAFVSERGGTREVWLSNTDGTEASQLTSLQGPTAGRPSWSPDGRYLAFHGGGISVMPADGGPSRRLSEDGEFPTWSADGRAIYFTRNRGGKYHVWRVPATGGAAVQAIASEAAAAREGPDGADLYFAKINGGIWRRPLAGGEETPVVQEFTSSLFGYWAVVSEGIYYVVRETLGDNTFVHHFKFFDFASHRTTDLGTLTGNIDPWVGGLTVSKDRQTVLYSQRTYQSSEVMLVEPFR